MPRNNEHDSQTDYSVSWYQIDAFGYDTPMKINRMTQCNIEVLNYRYSLCIYLRKCNAHFLVRSIIQWIPVKNLNRSKIACWCPCTNDKPYPCNCRMVIMHVEIGVQSEKNPKRTAGWGFDTSWLIYHNNNYICIWIERECVGNFMTLCLWKA